MMAAKKKKRKMNERNRKDDRESCYDDMQKYIKNNKHLLILLPFTAVDCSYHSVYKGSPCYSLCNPKCKKRQREARALKSMFLGAKVEKRKRRALRSAYTL